MSKIAPSLFAAVAVGIALAFAFSTADAIAGSAIDPGKATAGSITLAGDVTGAGNANTVAKINGVGLGSTTATSGNVLIGSGTQWVTQAVSGDATIATGGVLTLANSGVTAASYGDASHAVTVAFDAKGRATSASAPAIAIGEAAVSSLTTDLSARALKAGDTFTGSLVCAPTADVASLDVKQTSAGGAASDILDVTSSDGLTNDFKIDHTGASTFRGTVTATTFAGALSGNATTATTATNFSGSLSGDVTGTQSATSVGKINGVTLGTTTATSGNVLIGDGTQWATQAVSGDATITSAGVASVVGWHTAKCSVTAKTIALSTDVVPITTGCVDLTNSTGADITLGAPNISVTGAVDGEELVILNVPTSAHSVIFTNDTAVGGTLAGSKFSVINGSPFALAAGDFFVLRYLSSAGVWVVIASNAIPTLLSGGTVTNLTVGTLGLTNPLSPANGGTGLATLTSNGVLTGAGTGNVSVTSAGTAGQVLAGVTGGAPVFVTSTATCTLNGGTPATCTATVPTGCAHPVCGYGSAPTATTALFCTVSGTTVTAQDTAAETAVVNVICP